MRSNDDLALDHPGFNIALLTVRNLRSSLGLRRGRRLLITRCPAIRSPARAYLCLKGKMWEYWYPLVSLQLRCGLILWQTCLDDWVRSVPFLAIVYLIPRAFAGLPYVVQRSCARVLARHSKG